MDSTITIAFRLDLPEQVGIHPVFHVSQLKPYVSSSTPTVVTSPPPVYADRRGAYYEVETILGKQRRGRKWYYLIKWAGYDDSDNSWEEYADVRHLTDLVAAAPLIP